MGMPNSLPSAADDKKPEVAERMPDDLNEAYLQGVRDERASFTRDWGDQYSPLPRVDVKKPMATGEMNYDQRQAYRRGVEAERENSDRQLEEIRDRKRQQDWAFGEIERAFSQKRGHFGRRDPDIFKMLDSAVISQWGPDGLVHSNLLSDLKRLHDKHTLYMRIKPDLTLANLRKLLEEESNKIPQICEDLDRTSADLLRELIRRQALDAEERHFLNNPEDVRRRLSAVESEQSSYKNKKRDLDSLIEALAVVPHKEDTPVLEVFKFIENYREWERQERRRWGSS